MGKRKRNFVKTSVTLARNQLAYRQMLIGMDVLKWEPLGALIDRAIYRELMDARSRNLDEADRLRGTGRLVDKREAEWIRARWRDIGVIPAPPPRREPVPHKQERGMAVTPPVISIPEEPVVVEPEEDGKLETPAYTDNEDTKEEDVPYRFRLAPSSGYVPSFLRLGREADEDE